MKKVLITSAFSTLIVLAASNPSKEYSYEITPFASGILTDSKSGLDDKNYLNAGISLGRNLDDSFIDQIEVAYLRSDNLKYKDLAGSTNVNRLFLNAVKNFPLNEKFAAYALAGVGYQNVTHEAFEHTDSAVLNYGLGLRYDIPYYGISVKSDVRHLIAVENNANDFMYTLGLAMPLGKKYNDDIKATIPVVEEEKEIMPAKVEKPLVLPEDDDQDGVINRLDKCPNTTKGLKVNSDGCVETINLNINFDNNSADIKNSYNEKLVSFAKIMQENKNLTAVIEAHTDSKGSDSYNQTLSDRRAISVVNALKQYNIESSRLKAIGYGETQPIASNDNEEGKAQNRRVTALLNQ
ncbi:MAG: OmpA family protein [Arcobacteraceae bacterium]|jgi:OOP family OmpA-OmpF porin|nr:OmpA family protein [Arcobacteraceae bacterium]